ncbi:MAG: hypothetical protein OXH50_05680 [Gemmatimonadetes bacterium]|nr:hypothetical protein [Gemmatimonadota bacterium]
MDKFELKAGNLGALAFALLAVAAADPAEAVDQGEAAEQARSAAAAFTAEIGYVFWILGGLLILFGFYKLKKNWDERHRDMLGAVAATFAGMLMAAMAADQAMAKDLGDMARKGAAALGAFPAVISWLFYICGGMLVLFGFYKLKKNHDNPSQQSGMGVVTTVGAGVLMVVFPAAIEMLAGTLDLTPGGTISPGKMQ